VIGNLVTQWIGSLRWIGIYALAGSNGVTILDDDREVGTYSADTKLDSMARLLLPWTLGSTFILWTSSRVVSER
jgi:hypothetical protein